MSRLLGAPSVMSVDPVSALRRMQADGDDTPARLVPGARLFLHVIEPLVEGGVRARVVNGTAEHRVPFDAKPGARLHVLVTGTAGKPGYLLLDRDAASVDASLSRTARVLAALTPQREQATRPPVLQAQAPLLPGAPTDVPALARALADALSGSGLFYEAHQAQWVAGARERETLMNEPQARLTLRDASGERGPPAAAPEAPGKGGELTGIVHRDTVALVQQQLAALETGALVWRGEVWRGQTAEWTVARDGSNRNTDTHDASYGHWHTRITLTLPQLGAVEALLTLDAHGLEVRVQAQRGDTVDTLRTASAAYADALSAAGVTLRRLEVHHGG